MISCMKRRKTMDNNNQSETTQSYKNAYLENPMIFWKNFNKLMPSNAFNDTAKSWLPFSDQSGSIKNSLQKVTQYLAFNAKQNKTLLDWSGVWIDYLTILAKSHREIKTNGSSPILCINGNLAASKELLKSFISLLDGQMENISSLCEAETSSVTKKQPAEKSDSSRASNAKVTS